MSEWAHEHPEEATRIAALPPADQNAAERAAMAPWVERAKRSLEERLGLEGSHYSVSRLRLLEEYARDEERTD